MKSSSWRIALHVGLFAWLVGMDQWAKWWVSAKVPLLTTLVQGFPFGGISLFSFGGITCSLNQTFNTGIAWGVGAEYSTLWLILRLMTIGFLSIYLVRVLWVHRAEALLMVLVLAGAVGNVLDSLLYGHVIDFLHCSFWGHSFPIFNLADSWITLGVVGLLLWPYLVTRRWAR